MSPPLIETRGLSKHFGGVQAVRGIDFALAEGELALPDRPERRRQEHVLQASDRPDQADQRRRAVPRRRHHRAAGP